MSTRPSGPPGSGRPWDTWHRSGLTSRHGGIRLLTSTSDVQSATTAAADPRVQLVGYGPSASTIGGNRAGRAAAREVHRWVRATRTAGGGDGAVALLTTTGGASATVRAAS